MHSDYCFDLLCNIPKKTRNSVCFFNCLCVLFFVAFAFRTNCMCLCVVRFFFCFFSFAFIKNESDSMNVKNTKLKNFESKVTSKKREAISCLSLLYDCPGKNTGPGLEEYLQLFEIITKERERVERREKKCTHASN